MKKALCFGLAAVLAFLFCGCAKEESSVPTSVVQSTTQNVSESGSSLSSSISENSAISDNMSKDVISPSFEIEFNGQSICLPCKVKKINGIKIDTEYSFGSYQRDDGKYMSFAYYYYNNKRAGQIYLEGDCTRRSPDLDEENVIGLSVADSSVPMSYFGLTFGSDEKDITDMFGESDYGKTYYIEPEGSVIFFLNSKNKVKEIQLFVDIR